MTTTWFIILTCISFASSLQVLYTNTPYGPEMCHTITTRVEGCFTSFSRDNFTCIVATRHQIVPQICLMTRQQLRKCVTLKSKEEGKSPCSRESVDIASNGTVKSGSISQLLKSVNTNRIQTCIKLSNKQLLSIDLSYIRAFKQNGGSQIYICAYSDINVERAPDERGLVAPSKYQVCATGRIVFQTFAYDHSLYNNKEYKREVVWHRCLSSKPFGKCSFGKMTSIDVKRLELEEIVKAIETGSDLTLSEPKRRRNIQSIILPQSNGKLGFYMSRKELTTICEVMNKTTLLYCQNILFRAKAFVKGVNALTFIISKPWIKTFETGHNIRNLDELIRRIQSGHRVKIVITHDKMKTVVEAAVVFIQRTGFVCGQFLSTKTQPKRQPEIWRYISTKSSEISNNDVYRKGSRKTRFKERSLHVTWFVDPFPWEFAFHVRENGTVVSGSREEFIKNFQQGNMKVRVETQFEKHTIYESATRVQVDVQSQVIFAFMAPHFHLEMDDLQKFKDAKYHSQKVYCTVSSTAARSCEALPSKVKTYHKVQTQWFIQRCCA